MSTDTSTVATKKSNSLSKNDGKVALPASEKRRSSNGGRSKTKNLRQASGCQTLPKKRYG